MGAQVNFQAALNALRDGLKVRQPNGPVVELSVWVWPMCGEGLAPLQRVRATVFAECEFNRGCWFKPGEPKVFSPAEVAATDWEIVK